MHGGPCAKKTVTCWIVAADGETFTGTNWCRRPQDVCPRMARGEHRRDDYRLCELVCQQDGHAEVEALRKAGDRAQGATAYVDHHRCCPDCERTLQKAGIARIVLGKPPA